MTATSEPQHDQGIQQHGGGRGTLNRPACPTLRLLEPQMRLAALKRHLDRPTHGVPDEHLLGRCVVSHRVEGLDLSPTGQRLDRDDSQRTIRGESLADPTRRCQTAERTQEAVALPAGHPNEHTTRKTPQRQGGTGILAEEAWAACPCPIFLDPIPMIGNRGIAQAEACGSGGYWDGVLALRGQADDGVVSALRPTAPQRVFRFPLSLVGACFRLAAFDDRRILRLMLIG